MAATDPEAARWRRVAERRGRHIELVVARLRDAGSRIHRLEAAMPQMINLLGVREENKRLNEEIQALQDGDGYTKGHEHGTAAGEAVVAKLREGYEAKVWAAYERRFENNERVCTELRKEVERLETALEGVLSISNDYETRSHVEKALR